jgi:hypothetical protein
MYMLMGQIMFLFLPLAHLKLILTQMILLL